MAIIELEEKKGVSGNKKLSRVYAKFRDVLNEVRKKELPERIVEEVNKDILDLNSTPLIDKELRKLFERTLVKILKLLKKELKIVPKNYYRNLWLLLGMALFGLPIGIALVVAIPDKNYFFGSGIPIGMSIGMGIGLSMDKKALKEGRQLDVEVDFVV